MNKLGIGAYQFGSFVERRKVVLVFALFLTLPTVAVCLSLFAPSLGRLLFSPLCHQNPDRSLHLATALPLCARCFGLYLGFGLAGLLAPAFSLRFSKSFLAAAIFISAASALFAHFFLALDGNYARLLLGLSVGAGFALMFKSTLK